MNEDDSSRLVLAKALRELADGSSEVALRTALSRSYYSIFHAAAVVLGKAVDHGNLAKELSVIDPQIGEQVRKLQRFRAQADYDPTLVEREVKGNFEQFRIDARKAVDEGLFLFNRILRQIEAGSQK